MDKLIQFPDAAWGAAGVVLAAFFTASGAGINSLRVGKNSKERIQLDREKWREDVRRELLDDLHEAIGDCKEEITTINTAHSEEIAALNAAHEKEIKEIHEQHNIKLAEVVGMFTVKIKQKDNENGRLRKENKRLKGGDLLS